MISKLFNAKSTQIGSTLLLFGTILLIYLQPTMSNRICELSRRHRDRSQNVSVIFKDITKFTDLQKVVKMISGNLASIPDDIVYLNKRVMTEQIKFLNLKREQLLSYGLRFLEETSEIYKLRHKKMFDAFIRQRLDPLWKRMMFSILQEAAYPDNLEFSFEDVVQCEKTNPLALHTIDVMGKSKFEWSQRFVSAVHQFIRLRKLVELAGSLVAVGPSVSCHRQLNRLVTGCNTLSSEPHLIDPGYMEQTTVGMSEETICENYCINVVRGCLAPPLLFLPVEAVNLDPSFESTTGSNRPLTNLWERLISDAAERPGTSDIQYTLDSVWQSLNATTLVELIRVGLAKARIELSVRKANFFLLCKNGVPTGRTVPRSAGAVETPTEQSALSISSGNNLYQERQRIREKIQTLNVQLRKFARDRLNVSMLTQLTEQRYCSPSENPALSKTSEGCWNGAAFDRYVKPVLPFTMDGQRSNPEVILTKSDLYSIRPRPRAVDESRQSQEETAQADMNTDAVDSSNPLLQGGSDWDHNFGDSSGFRPIVEDLGFIPALSHSEISPDTVGAGAHTPESIPQPEAAVGCAPDDEDCAAEFENHPSELVDNTATDSSRIPVAKQGPSQRFVPFSTGILIEPMEPSSSSTAQVPVDTSQSILDHSASSASPKLESPSQAPIMGAQTKQENRSNRIFSPFRFWIIIFCLNWIHYQVDDWTW